MMIYIFTLWTFVAAAAPAKTMATHRIAIDDGGELNLPDGMSFAVVGNTRPNSTLLDKGAVFDGSAAEGVIGDILAQGMLGNPLTFLVHTGDMVVSSSAGNWKKFDRQFVGLLDGSSPSPSAARRIPVIPVAGDRDCERDAECKSFASTFAGFGSPIGYGRVATWQSFDLVVGAGMRWRVLVLDSNRKGLGSRWNEQKAWVPTAVKGEYNGLLIFMHEPAFSSKPADVDEDSQALLDLIAEHARLLSVKAVFSAGPHHSQAFAPEGGFGTMHVGTGGGGAPASDVPRGVSGGTTDHSLENTFSKGLDGLVGAWRSHETPPADKIIDEAMGTGSYDGYPRRLDAGAFPTYGWWKVGVVSTGLELTWRARQPDGTFTPQASWVWSEADGWTGK
jgi:hypothetical protein